VKAKLEGEGWWALRSPASKGCVDVVALKAGHPARFIEVKSTAAGPFSHFGPKDRAELLEAAGHAGAVAELAFWPPRGKLEYIGSSEWP
jgi:Holliday junction resolvase